jgi:hypothetical protein
MTDSGFLKALESASELEITFVGRKSGKRFSVPIWFVEEAGKLYLLPVNGTASKWFKSVLKNPLVDIRAPGRSATGKARAIMGAKEIDGTMERFRAKYGAGEVKKYYPRQDAAVELSI